MIDTENRYVAHIDILGMSSIVEKSAEEAWGVLSDLVDVRDKASALEIELVDSKERLQVNENLKMVTFSDTIVVFSKSGTLKELQIMIVLLTEIFHKALCRCVPVRIGLSYGKFYFNIEKSMYAGPALIEAYHVGEGSQWLGITLSKSVSKQAPDIEFFRTKKSLAIINWDVPYKNCTKKMNVVNWPSVFEHDFKASSPISVSQFYQAFSSTFGSFDSLSEEVKLKYINTVEFINEQLKCHKMA